MTAINATTITDAQIIALRAEAGAAGDTATWRACGRALNGSQRARRACARVIREAAAQR
jgi:hypothetical protein